MFLFFFSSRRRHTRYWRDWSSDVCSSDLDWSTPAIVLDKIIRYETVHEISDWDDLRRRIDPPDRRCYAFFHPALVDDPLIFVEVALTRDIPDAIAPILSPGREVMDTDKTRTAVF